MQNETIGAVTLDYRFYPGEDKYSDGSIEDEMLELAENHSEQEFNRIIAEKSSWPILYHFSHVRKNIVEWLPMTGQEHVLEIGAGPGAITGALAEKAKDVTCIDLSRRRSLINAYRNRSHDNIRILVGNFQDIAGALEEKFDVITLIGVFEYAQFSIQSEQPFVDYLLEIKRLLAPGGRLVIAIENRLGLKYWAGATEDHTGLYFEGIEGYPTTDYVRTFSRPELEQLFRRAGLGSWKFYYPYPDYKLPERFHSDTCLPRRGELTKNLQNFDRERIQLFDEAKVYDSLADSGLYPIYANSYVVIVQEEAGTRDACEEDLSGLVYDSGRYTVCSLRYSNERSEQFRIRTDILESSDGRRLVRKKAVSQAARAHIESAAAHYEQLHADLAGSTRFENQTSEERDESTLSVNRCEYHDGALYLEWLPGETLESELDALLAAGQKEAVTEKIAAYFQMFSDGAVEFEETPGFASVFGSQKQLTAQPRGKRLMCRKLSDIDMVFSNVVHTASGYQKIDCEWTFEFPVPVKYLQYRCIHYYVQGSEVRAAQLQESELYRSFGISKEEQSCFENMESHFQQYILGNYQPMWRLYDAISDGVIQVQPLVQEASRKRRSQTGTVEVYFDDGSGFHSENRRQYRVSGDGRIQLAIELPKGTRALRIDPYTCRCVVRVQKLEQDGEKLPFRANGHRMPNGDCLFDTEDPQIILTALRSDSHTVQVVLLIEPMDGITREALLAQDGRIRWMEQTKAWRLYQKLRKMKKKNK